MAGTDSKIGVWDETTIGGQPYWHSTGIEDRLPTTEAPEAPTGLAVTPGATTAALTWNAVTGADSIALYRRDDTAMGSFALVTDEITGNATSYNDTGLTPENEYSWYITATNEAGTSDPSSTVTDTTLAAGAWTPGEAPVVSGLSGGASHKSPLTITGSNFSSEIGATTYWTDFEGLTVGESAIAGVDFWSGDTAVAAKNYLVSDDAPLTGTRIAKAAPDQDNFGDNWVQLTDGWDEVFFEFAARTSRSDFTSSPDAPQIKFTRLHYGEGHDEQPHMGITIQGGTGGEPTLQVTPNPGTNVLQYPTGGAFVDDVWHRHTAYTKISTPDVADGERWYRTSFGNQWTYSGTGSYFDTPDAWADSPATVLTAATAGRNFDRLRFPFFQRTQQSSVVDIDYILVQPGRERVMLSTSPTLTASTSHTHVTCPTTARSSSEITALPMLDVFDVSDDVYVYVFNQDGIGNTTGVLLRAGV